MVIQQEMIQKDKRYLWMNTILATWQGEFDEQTGQAYYQTFTKFPE